MRRRFICVIAAVSVAASSGIALAGANGGAVPAACYSATAPAPDPHAQLPCKLVGGVDSQAGANCRIVDDADRTCSTVDGRDVDAAEIAAYQQSWAHRALSLQNALTATAPLIDEQLPHTHNSFNASAYSLPTDGSLPSYYPTLTNQDPNQVYSLADQLNMDVRVIELDLHWVPSPYGSPVTHGYWVTLCHGDGEQAPVVGAYVHVGCSDDRPAQDGFAEVRRWLDQHPDQFLLIYLENQLYPADPVASETQAHDTAAALLQQAFGRLVYRPRNVTPGHCADIPYGTSEQAMAATGARVLLLGNCGPGAWSSLVFQRGAAWDESGDPTTYDAKACARDQQLRAADTTFRREFEDSTFVTAATGTPRPPVTPAQVATMARCGVNIIGLDQLRPQDGRLAAQVWSWAPGQPTQWGYCALLDGHGRFESTGCEGRGQGACRTTTGDWRITSKEIYPEAAQRECAHEFAGSRFSVPVNGYSDAQLVQLAAGRLIWLNYGRDAAGHWRAHW
jgi:hypothetical protein